MKLTKQDLADLREARKEYRESRERAIHMSIDHVRNLLRIIRRLRAESQEGEDVMRHSDPQGWT